MPEAGEKVVVVRGKYAGHIAEIKSMADQTATLVVDGNTTGNIAFERFVSVGDEVLSTSGTYKGKVGTIKTIAEKTFRLMVDGEETGNLPPDSIAKHDGTDMVAPGTPNTASENEGDVETPEQVNAPSSVDSEPLNVDEHVVVVRGKYAGKIAKVKSIAGKTATLIVGDETTGNIPFEQFVREGDTVKSTSGTYDGKVGTIKSIAEKTLRLIVDGEETGNLPPGSIGKD